MNGAVTNRGLIISLIGTGISLATLIVFLNQNTNAAIRDMRADVADLREEVHAEIADLRERMARLEGLFEGFTKRETTE